ncbi:hypothetical protein PAXRUDRAFT_148141, partial [Paxillus rubicundulus Ve08.2h10]
PVGLAVHQDLGGGEILKVFVVHDDINRMAPGVECFVDGKEFFVMGVIVGFRSSEGPGVGGDWAEFIIQAADGKDASDGIVGGIGLNNDRGVRHPMSQNGSGGEGVFQTLESRVAFIGEVPQSIFPGEVSEWNNNAGIIENEAAVEVGKTEEGLDVSDFPRFRPISDSFDFVSGHCQATRGEEVFKVFNRGGVEFTFLRFGI